MLPCVPIFSPSFLVHGFVFLFLLTPTPSSLPNPKITGWLARPIANMWTTRDTIRNESWSWNVIYTWTLSPTIALSWLETYRSHYPLSVLIHSLALCFSLLVFSVLFNWNLELSLRFAFIFFSHKSVEFDFGGKFVFKGNVEFTHPFYSIKL